ncbi:hypothetical protein TNCV_3558541 [Trichonephila clavipes]|uniref:Uncharacterized protein n=1 Tax=Trichonephila clavipes TaxID=2585209 RepID=A0A8X6WDR6_TRICX|nr:hypothetical protein TNCV_3558541 [Trichonephila clavipes]
MLAENVPNSFHPPQACFTTLTHGLADEVKMCIFVTDFYLFYDPENKVDDRYYGSFVFKGLHASSQKEIHGVKSGDRVICVTGSFSPI